MPFVLTDGATNEGFSLGDAQKVIQGLKVPVYTIGYEADLKVSKQLSSLVEAANTNAGEGDQASRECLLSDLRWAGLPGEQIVDPRRRRRHGSVKTSSRR